MSIETKRYNKMDAIFYQGQKENCLYQVKLGSVGIYVNWGLADQKLLARLNADEYFGEMGVVENSPRSATAIALENGTIVNVISAEEFKQLLKEEPSRVYPVLAQLTNRLRQLTRDYSAVCGAIAAAQKAEEQSAPVNAYTLNELERYATIAR